MLEGGGNAGGYVLRVQTLPREFYRKREKKFQGCTNGSRRSKRHEEKKPWPERTSRALAYAKSGNSKRASVPSPDRRQMGRGRSPSNGAGGLGRFSWESVGKGHSEERSSPRTEEDNYRKKEYVIFLIPGFISLQGGGFLYAE